MATTLTINDLKQTKSELDRHKNWQSLATAILPDQQKSFLDSVADAIIEMDDQAEVIDIVIELAFKFIRFGYSDEIRMKSFNLLTLLKDISAVQKDPKRAQKVFIILKNLAQGTGTSSAEISSRACRELLGWLPFPNWDISKLATLFFIDIKANPRFNILHFKDDDQIDTAVLEILCKNIKALLSEGPRTYPALSNSSTGLTTDQILVRFMNQFINGPLRTNSADALGKSHPFVWNMVTEFISSPPGTSDTYKSTIQVSFAKSLISLSEQYEKALNKQLLTQKLADQETVLVQIDQFKDALSAISIEKLKKPIQKHVETLTGLQEQIFKAAE